MTAWLSTLLAFALTISAVTLCALVLTPMLRNRVSARSLYLAWLAVLVCALIPIRHSLRARPSPCPPRLWHAPWRCPCSPRGKRTRLLPQSRSLPPRTSCLSIQAARCLRPAQFSLPVPCNGARCCAWFT